MQKVDSSSSFEHVQLEESGPPSPERPASASASGKAAEQPAAQRVKQHPDSQANTPTEAGGAAEAGAPAVAPAAPPPLAAPAAAARPSPSAPADAGADDSEAGAVASALLGFLGPPLAGAGVRTGKARHAADADADADEGDYDEYDEDEGGRAGGRKAYDPVAEFEAEALDAANAAAHAVEEVGQKLLHGAAEAKESLASLAQGLSSWWSSFDPTNGSSAVAPATGGGSGSSAGGSSAGAKGGSSGGGGSGRRAQDVQQAAAGLELGAGETLLESFACCLLQTYTSTNNFFTPIKQVSFSGALHITSERVCFTFDDSGVAPIKLAGKAIRGVAKQAADEQQDLPERLEVQLEQGGQSLVLAYFSLQQLEMDSALALLEHLAEL